MKNNISIREWLITLVLLAIPLFNIFYFIYLITRPDEIGRYARAKAIFLLIVVLIIVSGCCYVWKEHKEFVNNAKEIVGNYLVGDKNEDKVIPYEGSSPNSLIINEEENEQWYGSDAVGYIKLKGNYNVYNIEPDEGMKAGIKIAGDNDVYTIYCYDNSDLDTIEKGLTVAYKGQGKNIQIEKDVVPKGSLGKNVDRITVDEDTVGYAFSNKNEVIYLVGTGYNAEFNIATYSKGKDEK